MEMLNEMYEEVTNHHGNRSESKDDDEYVAQMAWHIGGALSHLRAMYEYNYELANTQAGSSGITPLMKG